MANQLSGVAGVAADDVWAVGASETSPLIQHWDGARWSVVPGQSLPAYGRLSSVTAISATDVWAVGYGDAGGRSQTLTQHWDGVQWSTLPLPEPEGYDYALPSSITAASPNDVWVVGTGFYTDWTLPPSPCRYGCWGAVVEHWDGSSWRDVSPFVGGLVYDWSYAGLYSIDALSANDAWAVGSGYHSSLIIHWDGSAWAIANQPGVAVQDAVLTGVDAISPDNVWAVGYRYAGSHWQTLTQHWDGTQWSIVPSPNPGASDAYLNAVSARSAADVWAVGYSGGTAGTASLLEHWDGSRWSIVPSPDQGPGGGQLVAVAAIAGDNAWAVGGPLTERWDGTTWSIVPSPNRWLTRFSDVPAGSAFYDWVNCLACGGIVSGYSDGTFRPNDPVTRGQLAKIVSNAAGYAESFTTATFVDVPVGSAFHEYVERLASRGYVSGYACGGEGETCPATYFRPGANVTRGQTSKLVAMASGLPAPPAGRQTFEDIPPKGPGSTFWPWVEALAATGAIQGYACGKREPCVPPNNRPYFRPDANVSRGQAAKIVANTFFPGCSPSAKR